MTHTVTRRFYDPERKLVPATVPRSLRFVETNGADVVEEVMTKFMALYMAPQAAIDQMMKMPQEAMKEGMAAWNKWYEVHKKDLAETGAPLGKTKTVNGKGVSDTKNEITGYTVVEAPSHDAAAKLFVGHPHLAMQGTWIEVVEVTKMPEM